MQLVPDCTLVTACFDLTKYNSHSRDMSTAMLKIEALLSVPCYLIIYGDPVSIMHIREIRNDKYELQHLTKYIDMNFEDIDSYKYIETVRINRRVYHPTQDARTCPESHLLCCNKFDFLLKTIETNPFNTSKVGWIDSNVDSNMKKVCENYTNNTLLHILSNLSSDKFQIQILNVNNRELAYKENLKECYQTYRWTVCGCFFTVPLELGTYILSRLKEVFVEHTLAGYGHAEEMFFIGVLDQFYEYIERSYGDYGNILDNFIRPTRGWWYVDTFILGGYLNHGYYRELYDACDKLLAEFNTFRVPMDTERYFSILIKYFIAVCNYKEGSEADDVLEIIRNLIISNIEIKAEFNKNTGFYLSLFRKRMPCFVI